MRIVFFGTPVFSVASLQSLLHDRFTVAGVVTQPDKPQGRSRSELIPPPVKVAALAAGIPVLQPVRPVGDVFAASLRRLEPDLGVVVAYGHILRPDVLSVPPRGMINVHASLLPRHRGAAPIQHAILAGDRETGISIMQMEEGLDSGPVLHQVVTAIGSEETAGQLAGRLAEIGAAALVEAISLRSGGAARPAPQDHTQATYAPKLDREQAHIVWQRDAAEPGAADPCVRPAPGCLDRAGWEYAQAVRCAGGPGLGRAGNRSRNRRPSGDRGGQRRGRGVRGTARRQDPATSRGLVTRSRSAQAGQRLT